MHSGKKPSLLLHKFAPQNPPPCSPSPRTHPFLIRDVESSGVSKHLLPGLMEENHPPASQNFLYSTYEIFCLPSGLFRYEDMASIAYNMDGSWDLPEPE